MPVSIDDVASLAGVSRSTVSKALNGKAGDQLAPATRERVRRVALEMGYHPSAVARGLAGKRLNTLGIVFAQGNTFFATSPYFAAILDGVLEVALQCNQNTMLFTGQIWSDACHSLPILRDGRIDGLLLISPPAESDIVPAMRKAKMPFVLVGDESDDPYVSSIDVDNVGAAAMLTTRLLGYGHRRIAHLSGPETVSSTAQRLQGFRKTLDQWGVPFDETLLLPGTYLEPSGYERTHKLMRLPSQQRPTALFCGNDAIALGCLRALHELGVQVPTDISVVGFDDIALSATSAPPLTTVHQPMHQLGARAVEMLLDQLNDPESTGRKEFLPTDLVIRASAAPPPEVERSDKIGATRGVAGRRLIC